jgi:hypothetical protein
MADYLASLTVAMLADEELAGDLLYTLYRGPKLAEIEFAASVVFKAGEGMTAYEKKTRYYSISESKVTSNPTKEYDTRYRKVQSSEDGSPEAVYRMLLPEYARDLERLQWSTAIYNWAMATKVKYMQLPAVFLKWTNENDVARELRDAFESARNVAESYRLRASAESAVEQYRRNVARRSEPKAEVA